MKLPSCLGSSGWGRSRVARRQRVAVARTTRGPARWGADRDLTEAAVLLLRCLLAGAVRVPCSMLRKESLRSGWLENKGAKVGSEAND